MSSMGSGSNSLSGSTGRIRHDSEPMDYHDSNAYFTQQLTGDFFWESEKTPTVENPLEKFEILLFSDNINKVAVI